MYRHILIATDGSALAEKAVSHGLSLAKSIGAKVTALVVDAPFNIGNVPQSRVAHLPAYAELSEHVRQHAIETLARVADAAKVAGVRCDTVRVEHDRPDVGIVATAKDRACDLIVVASQGHSGMSQLLLGSVTNKVLAQTIIPVLVCR